MRSSTDYIIIHCSDTPKEMDIGADTIRRWHVEENGWSDIGYHWIIKRDGTIEPGRSQDAVGAHARNYNDKSVGVCMVGGKPEANFTSAQWSQLESLILQLRVEYPRAQIIGHNQVSGKTCPNFDVESWSSTI